MLFIVFFTSHRSPLSERLEQATSVRDRSPEVRIMVAPLPVSTFENKREMQQKHLYIFFCIKASEHIKPSFCLSSFIFLAEFQAMYLIT